jgi:hypothetical protein
MTQSRRDRQDDDLARGWLAKHAPKHVSKPKSKPQHRKRWQRRKQERQQEWSVLAKPLLRGI